MTYRFLSAFDAAEEAAAPLDAAFFAALMRPFEALFMPGSVLGIAVSGGPDSMALAYCLGRWAKTRQTQALSLRAFLVDHRLRPESADEAKTVKERLEALDIPCQISVWEHEAIHTRVHVLARAARYHLLEAACRANGIQTLALAHQAEDQAETVLERLAKGSGTDGLAGIAAQNRLSAPSNLTLIRPLLCVPKARLIATCHEARLAFVEDPTNGAAKYARGRLRRVMPLLESEGLSLPRLLDLAARAAEDKEALGTLTETFLQQAYREDDGGTGSLSRTAFLELQPAIAHRALDQIMRRIAPHPYPLERAKRLRLIEALRGKEALKPYNLGGVLVVPAQDQIHFFREAAQIHDCRAIEPGTSFVWDHRWHIELTSAPRAAHQNLEIRKLGLYPRADIEKHAPELARALPQSRARAALPALWQGDRLLALPTLKGPLNAVFSFDRLLPLAEEKMTKATASNNSFFG